MQKLSVIALALGLALGWSSTSLAGAEPPAPTKARKQKAKKASKKRAKKKGKRAPAKKKSTKKPTKAAKNFDFEGDEIDAEKIGADGSTVFGLPREKRSSLIRLRPHFIPEILKSAEML